MSHPFHTPVFQAMDAGRPAPGARLTFLLSGTDQRRDVYADVGRSVPLPNPVIADSGGYFPPVYMDAGSSYDVALSRGQDVLHEWPAWSPGAPDPFQARDASGRPVPNARLQFFAHGTTTPILAYADSGLSDALGSEVTADDEGQFPAMWLAGPYRARLMTGDGVLMWDVDPAIGGFYDIPPPPPGIELLGVSDVLSGTISPPGVLALDYTIPAGTEHRRLFLMLVAGSVGGDPAQGQMYLGEVAPGPTQFANLGSGNVGVTNSYGTLRTIAVGTAAGDTEILCDFFFGSSTTQVRAVVACFDRVGASQGSANQLGPSSPGFFGPGFVEFDPLDGPFPAGSLIVTGGAFRRGTGATEIYGVERDGAGPDDQFSVDSTFSINTGAPDSIRGAIAHKVLSIGDPDLQSVDGLMWVGLDGVDRVRGILVIYGPLA